MENNKPETVLILSPVLITEENVRLIMNLTILNRWDKIGLLEGFKFHEKFVVSILCEETLNYLVHIAVRLNSNHENFTFPLLRKLWVNMKLQSYFNEIDYSDVEKLYYEEADRNLMLKVIELYISKPLLGEEKLKTISRDLLFYIKLLVPKLLLDFHSYTDNNYDFFSKQIVNSNLEEDVDIVEGEFIHHYCQNVFDIKNYTSNISKDTFTQPPMISTSTKFNIVND